MPVVLYLMCVALAGILWSLGVVAAAGVFVFIAVLLVWRVEAVKAARVARDAARKAKPVVRVPVDQRT